MIIFEILDGLFQNIARHRKE